MQTMLEAVDAPPDAPPGALPGAPPDESWSLFDLISARPLPIEASQPAQTLQLSIRALLASLGFAALYGVAVGCTDPGQAAHNLVALPMVLLLSVGCALPLGLLAWKVVGEGVRLVDLATSVTTGVFTAALVLGASAPLLALYYLTTDYVGAPLAMLVVTAATVAGVANAFRAGLRRAASAHRLAVLVPLGTMLGCLLAAELQLIHLAAPILPEDTPFDHGIEWWLR
jgi:hypothetical protein